MNNKCPRRLCLFKNLMIMAFRGKILKSNLNMSGNLSHISLILTINPKPLENCKFKYTLFAPKEDLKYIDF